MTFTANKLTRYIMTVPLFLIAAGCGSSQNEMVAKDRLEQARIVYQQAKSNPAVTGSAQVPLQEAEKDLRAAEMTSDYKEMEHRAYLAEKKAQTAIAIAEGTAAEREHEQLLRQSHEAVLSKKEREMAAKGRELDSAKTEAERSRADAERSRTAAESSRTDAERAKAEAERAKTESESSKMESDRLKREAEKARADNEQLMKELSELKGKQTDRGIVLTIGDVLFETGKAKLSTPANVSIAKLAQFLMNHPNRNVVIEGHTDSVGTDEYNLALSERRAEAVKRALVDRGVGAERIVAKGLGKKFPVASNVTAQGRQMNRRVEVVILNEGVKP